MIPNVTVAGYGLVLAAFPEAFMATPSPNNCMMLFITQIYMVVT